MPSDNTNDIVISTRNLSKVYKLYRSPQDRLKEALHPGRKKYHKDFYALKDVNLEIRRGEVIGIVGKNGSGKSTLLKILSRVLTPSSGEFEVKGKVSSLLELGSGFNPELTGLENIFFYGTILGFTEEKIRGKLDEILDFADIGDFVYQPLKTYSSGMKARLAFSVAINVDPDILILDEVLAVGDELFRRKCYARMEGFFKGGKTILFVSHSVSDVNQFCTRAVMLDGGEFIIEGPSKLVTAQYQRYLFAPKERMEQVLNEVVKLNDNTVLKEATYEEVLKGKEKGKLMTKPAHNTGLIKAEISKQASDVVEQKAYFMPGFESKSRVEYKNADIEMKDFCIKDTNGKKVNALITGESYNLFYNVLFKTNANNVYFGAMFRTEKGLNLSGSNTSLFDNIIQSVPKDSTINVQCRFTCHFLQGNYYVNLHVCSKKNHETEILCKINDAVAFKVLPPQKKLINGHLTLDQKFEIKQF